MSTDLKNIPIDQLVEPWIFLRIVDEHGVEFAELQSSIQDHGLLASIAVRQSKLKEGKYEVIDGMWRLTACRNLEWEEMPCIIKIATDDEVLALQLSANAIRPETKPCDFARQLRRIQKYYLESTGVEITIRKLADMVNKGPSWIKLQLDLNKLGPQIQKMVDRGEIPVGNAYYLAKIPRRFREEYLTQAKTMKVAKFKAMAQSIIKQYREAVKQGNVDAFWTDDWQPQPHLRSLVETLIEYENHQCMVETIARMEDTSPPAVWLAALQWMMRMDEDSVREQQEAARGRSRKQFEESSRERIE